MKKFIYRVRGDGLCIYGIRATTGSRGGKFLPVRGPAVLVVFGQSWSILHGSSPIRSWQSWRELIPGCDNKNLSK